MKSKDSFARRKERAMEADLATAFSCYDRLKNQVLMIRGWMLLVLTAFIGWKLRSPDFRWFAVVVFIGFFALLLILELRERSSMSFNKKNVQEIQRIQMLEDEFEYIEELKKYKFRDFQLAELTRCKKIEHLRNSAKLPEVIFWNVLIVIVFIIVSFYPYSRKDEISPKRTHGGLIEQSNAS
jgi:hypothetical protein